MKSLNQREEAVLRYIMRSIEECGYAPSVRDIARALDYKSTSTVQLYLDRLQSYGYLRREGGKSRSLRVVGRGIVRALPLLKKLPQTPDALGEDCFDGSFDFCFYGDEATECFAYRTEADGKEFARDTILIVSKTERSGKRFLSLCVGGVEVTREYLPEKSLGAIVAAIQYF